MSAEVEEVEFGLGRPALAEVKLGAEAAGPAHARLCGPDACVVGGEAGDERHCRGRRGAWNAAVRGGDRIITRRRDLAVLERDTALYIVQRALVAAKPGREGARSRSGQVDTPWPFFRPSRQSPS